MFSLTLASIPSGNMWLKKLELSIGLCNLLWCMLCGAALFVGGFFQGMEWWQGRALSIYKITITPLYTYFLGVNSSTCFLSSTLFLGTDSTLWFSSVTDNMTKKIVIVINLFSTCMDLMTSCLWKLYLYLHSFCHIVKFMHACASLKTLYP